MRIQCRWKPLTFINDKRQLVYYAGTEHNEAYFDLTDKLLGLRKTVDFSFIAQCFPIKGAWAKEFFECVETRHGKSWVDVLLDLIDFNNYSGFSEYETLGTFITYQHPNEFTVTQNPWLRGGNGIIGTQKNMDRFPFSLLLKPYDFVSFENWDRPIND